MSRFFAEFIGTLALVLFGCGAAVLGGEEVGQLGIALAFGFALLAMAYAIGPISGCHINPAVSLAMFISGRMTAKEMSLYWIAQFTGALAGAALVAAIAGGTAGGLGQNGWGPDYAGGYSLGEAFLFETVMTTLFVIVILGATSDWAVTGSAGLAIGISLAVIHIVGIHVTGVSVNPARSFGPAVLVGGQALQQLWLFFVAPALGASIGAALFRYRLLSTVAKPTAERIDTTTAAHQV